ncbi:hypothetical protein B0X71_11800 [Planococcus lenghuensis]|uniref:Uncharacterized protein n=1 Tax=Planococcus lenghuensis TaxID=2213202 RepID=A0A1Q2KZS6_9BACL|nr:hypothetical protein B0X71_11800 [Planococcus lenghuensis]
MNCAVQALLGQRFFRIGSVKGERFLRSMGEGMKKFVFTFVKGMAFMLEEHGEYDGAEINRSDNFRSRIKAKRYNQE